MATQSTYVFKDATDPAKTLGDVAVQMIHAGIGRYVDIAPPDSKDLSIQEGHIKVAGQSLIALRAHPEGNDIVVTCSSTHAKATLFGHKFEAAAEASGGQRRDEERSRAS